MKKQILKSIALIIILVSLSLILDAQPGGGGGQPGGGPPPGSGAVPIDGGAILLAIGAAAYGRYKMKAEKE